MPMSISMKAFRKEISNGILFWEQRMPCAGCFVGLLVGLFTCTPGQLGLNAYIWISVSGISILETPNSCLCVMTLKHVFFFFFSALFPLFYLLSHLPFYLPFYQFLHFCLFSQIIKLKCKKVLSLFSWETS